MDMTSTVACLLHCLPLLRTGNAPAKTAYLHVLPTVLRRATDTRQHLADCQQILSYALIHPAISADELMPLSAWQPQLQHDTDSVVVPSRAVDHEYAVVNGPTASLDVVTNGPACPQHRDLSAARSLPVGLLRGTSSAVIGSARPSRTTSSAASGNTGTVNVQQSSPPLGLPRALTPPRLSKCSPFLYCMILCITFSFPKYHDSTTVVALWCTCHTCQQLYRCTKTWHNHIDSMFIP